MVEERSDGALDALALAARQLQSAGTAEALLQQIVDMAVASISGCAFAGVSTEHDGRTDSPVVSDPDVFAIDALQYSIGQGPCLQAMRGPDVLVDAPDLQSDERFGRFGVEAAKAQCRAVLAHRLYVDTQTLGSLNLYAMRPHAFTDADRARAVVLSAMASMAVNIMQLALDGEGLREAVQTRDVIGQAKGILMEREQIGSDEAFARLLRLSQDGNIKLRELAEQITSRHEPAPGAHGEA